MQRTFLLLCYHKRPILLLGTRTNRNYRMTGTSSARDPTTVSNYDRFRTRHIAANFNIDFAKEQLRGKVILDLEVLKKSNEIVLDTSYLDVTDIKVDGSSTNWTLEARTEPYGSPLKIQSPSNVAIGQHVNVSVYMASIRLCSRSD